MLPTKLCASSSSSSASCPSRRATATSPDEGQDGVKGRRRHVSLDEGIWPTEVKGATPEMPRSARAYSVGSSSVKMKALNFEEIDVDGTPLSSQRSCSEFLRYNSLNSQKMHLEFRDGQNVKRKRSFFSYLFGMGNSSKSLEGSNNRTNNIRNSSSGFGGTATAADVSHNSVKRVQFMDEDEASFLISQLRGTSRTESTNTSTYRSSSSSHSQSHFRINNSVDRDAPLLHEEPGCMDFVFGQVPVSNNYTRASPSISTASSISHSRKAILQESSLALDLILGIRYGTKKRLPMEIELKTLEPSVRRLNTVDSTTTFSRSHSRSSFSGLSSRESEMARSSSQHSLNSLVDDRLSAEDLDDPEHLPLLNNQNLAFLSKFSRASCESLAWLARTCRVSVTGPEDDAYYEQIRIQPFATGAYLRGMLVAGFASLFFNFYSLSMWPDFSVPIALVDTEGNFPVEQQQEHFDSFHSLVEKCLYAMLLTQLFFNLLQLPMRIWLHLKCWESSRTINVDTAINLIRNMLHSDVWLLNRVLGRILDALSICTLLVGEAYLRCLPSDDPLHVLVVSLCSTNLLAIFVRLVIATVFALSMHDPQVLSDARRRGLSKWDLEVLPAFVFTSLKEVTNHECSICLAAFDAGEMLISLPCDNKHSFHASCIRQWLERQNSCPLCQRIV